jgi:hypothetical protein
MGIQRDTAGRATMGIYIQVRSPFPSLRSLRACIVFNTGADILHSQIIFAAALERIFFHVVPSTLSFIGCGIIICSALFTAVWI